MLEMPESDLLDLADLLRSRGERLCTAESCTGGLIAAECTSLAGSSDWFECGFVTYSNQAKSEMLGVEAELIDSDGAKSGRRAAACCNSTVTATPSASRRCALHWPNCEK